MILQFILKKNKRVLKTVPRFSDLVMLSTFDTGCSISYHELKDKSHMFSVFRKTEVTGKWVVPDVFSLNPSYCKNLPTKRRNT